MLAETEHYFGGNDLHAQVEYVYGVEDVLFILFLEC